MPRRGSEADERNADQTLRAGVDDRVWVRYAEAKRAASGTKLFKLTESLGGTASLIELPFFMSHASMSEEARERCGITPGLVRLSIGLEDPTDLVGDLDRAMES